MAVITHRKLQTASGGEWISDGGTRGDGTMYARKLPGGAILFYFRYTNAKGAREALPLGEWDGTGGALSLAAARERAKTLSVRYRGGDRDLASVLDAEEREARRLREVAERAEEAAQARRGATLKALMDAYVGWLESKGKSSADRVAGTIRRHVTEPWPKLSCTPADDVTTDDLMPVLTRLTDGGKLREAAKIRSYLQAAYSAGIKARTTASATPALRGLQIRTNPARDLGTIEGASNAKDRALSVTELRAYWKRINAAPDQDTACLRFHLLTGGQRIDQLARLKVADYDQDQGTVTLRDPKGRRKVARAHVVPLIPSAVDALERMIPIVEGAKGVEGERKRLGDYLFTVTAGESGMASSTAYLRCREVMEAMLEAQELPGGSFSLTDIRRTVETRLADLRVSSDVRAQLQSHGLGGVQTRHYDRHDYLQEKREALESLHVLLTESKTKMVEVRGRKRV